MEIDRNAPVTGLAEIEVDAAPDAVWALVSDIDRWPEWDPDVKEARCDGDLAPGTTFHWKAGPGTIVSRFGVVDPPRKIAWTGRTFGIRAVHVYLLEPTAGGTKVVSEESWRGLPARLLRARMASTLQTSLAAGLGHLKAAAERHGP